MKNESKQLFEIFVLTKHCQIDYSFLNPDWFLESLLNLTWNLKNKQTNKQPPLKH